MSTQKMRYTQNRKKTFWGFVFHYILVFNLLQYCLGNSFYDRLPPLFLLQKKLVRFEIDSNFIPPTDLLFSKNWFTEAFCLVLNYLCVHLKFEQTVVDSFRHNISLLDSEIY